MADRPGQRPRAGRPARDHPTEGEPIGAINPIHVVLVFAIALLVLGPKRLPEAGRSLGRGLREFKHSLGGHADDGPALPAGAPTDAGEKPRHAADSQSTD